MNVKKQTSDFLFVLWAGGGALIAYFLVYSLRKAFTASTFDGLELFGMDYKVVISISQIIGYLLSKFCGIKFVSELKRNHRLSAIIASVSCAELALVLFGLIPYPFNAICLFFNGLSLGCMWGFLFAYIEGRKLTDILASFLGVSIVVSSGAAKSFGLFVLDFGVSPFWMPAIIGAIALPLLITIACLLDKLPEPTIEDKAHRIERAPLNGKQRMVLFKKYSVLLIPLLLVNVLFTVLRDIKEDFLVDILEHTSLNLTSFLFVKLDAIVTFVLLVVLGSMILVKDNKKALYILMTLMMFGSLLILFTSVFSDKLIMHPIGWMLLQSLGIYTAYLAFQTVFFDRFIARFRITGNVGFFIYLADFLGYLASCVFLLGKFTFNLHINWLQYYNFLSLGIALISICLIGFTFLMMYPKNINRILKIKQNEKESNRVCYS
jgi:MFS family permease